MTWALMAAAGLLWLFRKPVAALLAPHVPNREKRRQLLGIVIAAFLIVAALRVAVYVAGW